MVTTTATITMSMCELDRLKTIQAVVDRMARVGPAAQRLGLSRRQLKRLIQRYKEDGVDGLVSRKRGRPSNRQLAPGVAERATALIRDRYADFGPTLACEKLRECHGLPLAKETVRVLMMAAGLWKPRKQRATKIHQPRNRRACVGELIQIARAAPLHGPFLSRAIDLVGLPRSLHDEAETRLSYLLFLLW